MELRHLSATDESEATAAHQDLAAEGFDFLLGYEPGMKWANFLQKTEKLRLGDGLGQIRCPQPSWSRRKQANL